MAVGQTFTVGAAPTRTGYSFSTSGWSTSTYTSGTVTTGTVQPGATVTPAGDMTLTAQWTPWVHTVSFSANGGTGTLPTSFTKTTGVSVYIENASEETDTIPTRDGYLFVEWNTKADGTGISYQPGDEYTTVQNGGTVTLYAVWISTDIYLYSNGKCEAIEFIEGGTGLAFYDNGEVRMPQFIEGAAFSIEANEFNIGELIEK